MKIIDYEFPSAMGHDGIDYFIVTERLHHRFVFSYLNGLEFHDQHEGSFFYYHNSRGDYLEKAWELGRACIGRNYDVVKRGKVHRQEYSVNEPIVYNHFPSYSAYSPHWCIVAQTPYKDTFATTFGSSLTLLGQENLAKKLPTTPRDILIIDRLSGQIHPMTLSFNIRQKIVIALDEQTFAFPGEEQVAVVDLNF